MRGMSGGMGMGMGGSGRSRSMRTGRAKMSDTSFGLPKLDMEMGMEDEPMLRDHTKAYHPARVALRLRKLHQKRWGS